MQNGVVVVFAQTLAPRLRDFLIIGNRSPHLDRYFRFLVPRLLWLEFCRKVTAFGGR